MKIRLYILLLLIIVSNGFSQTKNENLNKQLKEMKSFFLAGDYENFTKYTYPEIIAAVGGKANLVASTKQVMTKMKNDGFSFIDWKFKEPSEFLKKENQLQCSLTQVITMKTPKGLLESEYSLIAISVDEGKNWTFIDTSGRDKKAILQFFPNLHENIVVKQKQQKLIE